MSTYTDLSMKGYGNAGPFSEHTTHITEQNSPAVTVLLCNGFCSFALVFPLLARKLTALGIESEIVVLISLTNYVRRPRFLK